jgi:DUF971 family protein
VASGNPIAIRVDLKTNRLEIDWEDGVTSRYDGGYLRFICPCAGCRGHGPGQVPEPEWAHCKDVRMTGAEGVGTYAMRLHLSDGHASGIYAFDYLRAHDPGPDAGRGLEPRA